ncbi:hypothetical protein [Marinimicrobium agarilyticum]|uniref:hypothetical protein n=1 Tax=Marinimicrobium agarilyticum TaxID=306546 RepID=UPI0004086CD7|nr:hypothetical protein [Marinimicrobium agarilyticum]
MNPLKLLHVAHAGMLLSLVLSLGALSLAYMFSHSLGLATQVASHIALIVFPAFFKLGYVLRLTALKQLGRAVD